MAEDIWGRKLFELLSRINTAIFSSPRNNYNNSDFNKATGVAHFRSHSNCCPSKFPFPYLDSYNVAGYCVHLPVHLAKHTSKISKLHIAHPLTTSPYNAEPLNVIFKPYVGVPPPIYDVTYFIGRS